MIYAGIVSIFVIAGIAWLLVKVFNWRICPVCAGVSGTWIWMLAAFWLNYEIDILVLGILMGGSIVGIAYQLEKHLSDMGFAMFWKLGFIPAGFLVVYGILAGGTAYLVGLVGMGLMAILFFFRKGGHKKNSSQVEDLEKKMKNCC